MDRISTCRLDPCICVYVCAYYIYISQSMAMTSRIIVIVFYFCIFYLISVICYQCNSHFFVFVFAFFCICISIFLYQYLHLCKVLLFWKEGFGCSSRIRLECGSAAFWARRRTRLLIGRRSAAFRPMRGEDLLGPVWPGFWCRQSGSHSKALHKPALNL